MKKLTQIIEASTLNIQSDAIGYIDAPDLEKFKRIAEKFISAEAIEVIDWLIAHGTDYVQILGKGKKGNALELFYNAGVPTDEELKPLYKAIGKLKKADHLMEIPLFLTQEQFDGILAKQIAPDEIFLDLKSEKGRNDVVAKFTPMVHKIARQLIGKSANLEYEDLLQYGFMGLTWAMNDYGKWNSEKAKTDKETYKKQTFFTYAYGRVYNAMVNYMASDSRTVRVPNSEQKRQKEEQGFITKNNSVSGDKVVATSKDGTKDKTLFDFVGGSEEATTDIEKSDKEFLWKKVRERIIELADDRTWEILKMRFGLEGTEKLENKEIAKKLDCGESLVTYYVKKALKLFLADPTIKKYGSELRELMAESRSRKEAEEDQLFEPQQVKIINVED